MRQFGKKESKDKKSSTIEAKKAFFPESKDFGTVYFYGQPEDLLNDDKKFKRFITTIEKIVRRSLECKSFVKYLKDELKMDHCYFLQNVKLTKIVQLEVHHTPFTLYDIVKIVATKMIQKEEKPFSTFMIAKKVTELHYRGVIGLVPVSKTIHELIHAGRLVVPPHVIFGNIQKFVEEYFDFIEEDYLKKLYALLTLEDEQVAKINSLIIARPLQYSKDSKKQREDLKKFFEEKANEVIETEEVSSKKEESK